MTTIDATSLADITISLLERTAMVLAEPADDGDETPRPTRFARVVYKGPSRGSLVLCANEGFLRAIAASLLGVEGAEVDLDRDGNDGLKEMANTVAGSVVLALAGDQCEYQLGLPEIVTAREVPAKANAECTVVTEGGALRVLWNDAQAAHGN